MPGDLSVASILERFPAPAICRIWLGVTSCAIGCQPFLVGLAAGLAGFLGGGLTIPGLRAALDGYPFTAGPAMTAATLSAACAAPPADRPADPPTALVGAELELRVLLGAGVFFGAELELFGAGRGMLLGIGLWVPVRAELGLLVPCAFALSRSAFSSGPASRRITPICSRTPARIRPAVSSSTAKRARRMSDLPVQITGQVDLVRGRRCPPGGVVPFDEEGVDPILGQAPVEGVNPTWL
jgi:hypothetical protein